MSHITADQKALGRVMPTSLANEMQRAITEFVESFNFQSMLPRPGERKETKPNLWNLVLMVALVEPDCKCWHVTIWADGLGYQQERWRLERTFAFKRNEDNTYSIIGHVNK